MEVFIKIKFYALFGYADWQTFTEVSEDSSASNCRKTYSS